MNKTQSKLSDPRLQSRIGYEFKQLELLQLALTHRFVSNKYNYDLKLSRCLILSTGELKSGGHHRESILADTVEAIIGAIYVDSADLNLLNKIVLNWYVPYLDHIEPTDQLKDPKSRLQEYLQARKKPLPVYEVVDIQGDAPHQHFKVECVVAGLPNVLGEGSSRRFAEQAAAAEILKLLEQ